MERQQEEVPTDTELLGHKNPNPTDNPPFDGFKRCHVTRSTQWSVVTETALSVPVHQARQTL